MKIPALPNLLLAPEFKQTILDRQESWREVIATAAKVGYSGACIQRLAGLF